MVVKSMAQGSDRKYLEARATIVGYDHVHVQIPGSLGNRVYGYAVDVKCNLFRSLIELVFPYGTHTTSLASGKDYIEMRITPYDNDSFKIQIPVNCWPEFDLPMGKYKTDPSRISLKICDNCLSEDAKKLENWMLNEIEKASE